MSDHVLTPTDGAGRAGPRTATAREWIGLSVLALACLVYVMDLTVLHLAIPTISAELNPTSSQLLWIIDIYGYMVAGFLITMGTLGDRIGRRKLLLIGSAAFGAVSIIAAFSTSTEMLIGTRALLGIAGATLAPSTLSLIFTMFEVPKQRSFAVAVWISAFSAGSAVGPILGGVVLERFPRGAVFLLAVPVMALLLVLGPLVLPEYRDPAAGRLDLLSVVLSLGAVLASIYGFKQIAQDRVSASPLIAIALGLGLGALFARRQFRLTDPLFDLGLFRIPAFRGALLVNMLALFVMVGYFLFVAQYLQLVLGLTPLRAGLWSLPSALAFIVGSNLAPRLAPRARPAVVIGAGLALAAVGAGLLTQVGGANGLASIVAASVIISLGLAPVFGLTTELIVGTAPPEKAGAASGLSETASELGGALGISILGSIGVALYRTQVTAAMPADVPAFAAERARDTLGAAVGVAAQLPAGAQTALLDVARGAFVDGMRLAALISAVIAVLAAFVAACSLRHVSRDAVAETAHEATNDAAAAPNLVNDPVAIANPDRERSRAAA